MGQAEKVVNSNAYWNHRFRENWVGNNGREQTAFFGHIALINFPPWFSKYLQQPGRTICDIGCALGDATKLLAEAYPEALVTGVDFSPDAIALAQENYRQARFEVGDIHDYAKEHDVFFCSNTLEHFADPRPLIEHLCRVAKRFIVVLVPFREKIGIAEHLTYFDETIFSKHVPKAVRLVHGVITDCSRLPGTRWSGDQVLMILEKRPDEAEVGAA